MELAILERNSIVDARAVMRAEEMALVLKQCPDAEKTIRCREGDHMTLPRRIGGTQENTSQ